jgi:drug/metabolite transporter (DMT)-like permease
MSLWAAAALAVAVFAWGLSNVATRYALTAMSPLNLVTIRYTLAAALFGPLVAGAGRRAWRRPDLLRLALWGFFGVVGFNLPVTVGTQWLPAGTMGLLVSTEPVWIAAIAVAVLRERPGWTLPAGLVLGTAGAAALIVGRAPGGPLLAEATPAQFVAGGVLGMAGACSWAVYAVAVRPYIRLYGAVASTGVSVMLGSAPLLLAWSPGLLARAAHLSGAVWAALVFLGAACTVLATLLWNYAAARTSAARAGIWLYAVPLTAVLGGRWLLGEPMVPSTIIGGAMILTGVAVAQWRPQGTGRAGAPEVRR